MEYVISTDTGGTFVDAVIIDSNGKLAVGKHSSTPGKPSFGILGATTAAAKKFNITLTQALANCKLFLNGTTVTTNAMIQQRGAKTGLLITRGFEDTLLIGRIKARTAGLDEREITNYQHAERPRPIVPISLTRGVTERIDFSGKVLCSMSDQEVILSVNELVAEGIEALAICLLWSFKNSTHEQRIKTLVKEHHPNLFITASSDLVPLMREYERANTTAINSFLGPTLDHYVSDIEKSLQNESYEKDLLLMQSVGGLSPSKDIRYTPITTLLSGPVGGVIATKNLGVLLDEKNLISTDMGGTSFDVGLIVDGSPQSTPITVMERYIVMFPAVDIVTVGAGGGSLIWLDNAMTLKVGPMSQGSNPGPACYRRGGIEPTVTDADVLLGYINPDYFLGGEMQLDASLSKEVLIKRICEPIGMSLEEAAWGAYEIVNAHMADLIRQASVERGHDPRDFVLVAFGGCGPTHCTGYGPDIGAKKIIVPITAPVFSALGIAQSDIKHFYSRSVYLRLKENEIVEKSRLDEINIVLSELMDMGRKQLEREGFIVNGTMLKTSLDMRFRGQVNELVIPVESLISLDTIRHARDNFLSLYERTYGSGASSELSDIEVVTARVDAISPTTAQISSISIDNVTNSKQPISERKVYWGRKEKWFKTPIYKGENLPVDTVISGPAVLEYYATTIPLPPGHNAYIDQYRNLIIT